MSESNGNSLELEPLKNGSTEEYTVQSEDIEDLDFQIVKTVNSITLTIPSELTGDFVKRILKKFENERRAELSGILSLVILLLFNFIEVNVILV